MNRLRIACIGVSIDGFAAGPNQDLAHPLGVGGESLFEWFFATPTFQKIHGGDSAVTKDAQGGIDDEFAVRGFEGVGAWILGRNMFGPVRGPWPDDSWKGWWGPSPPYHVPVFVLTHHPRASIVMEGGTTFHFVTEGIHATLERAREAAGSKDVRIGGGAATLRQYLVAGLVDEMHLVISPVLLGTGEPLFAGINLPKLGFRRTECVASPKATHVVLTKQT